MQNAKYRDLKNILPSLSFYLVGLAATFSIDLFIVKFESVDRVAEWALVKSVVLFGAVVVLFGVDQLMVRNPSRLKILLVRGAGTAIVASVFYVMVIFSIGLIDSIVHAMLAVISLSLVTLCYAYRRASMNFSQAQFVNQLWRPLMLGIVVLLYWRGTNESFYEMITISCLVSITTAYLVGKAMQINKFELDDIPASVELPAGGIFPDVKLGMLFQLSLISLSASIYFEQMLLNSMGATRESAIYFSHTSIVLPPIIILNGFVGFLLGPYVKKHSNKFAINYRNKLKFLVIVVVFVGVVSLVFSKIVFNHFAGSQMEFDITLALMIVVLGIMRLIYVLPSSVIGAIGQTSDVKMFVLSNVFSTLIFLVLFGIFSRYNENILYSIVLANLFNWVIKSFVGMRLVNRVLDDLELQS